MKTINNIWIKSSFLFTILLCSTACRKQLDKQPFNAISEQFAFKTTTDFDNALRGMYKRIVGFSLSPAPGIPTNGYYAGGDNGSDMIILPDLLADNLIISQNGRGTFETTGHWVYDGNTNVVNLFRDAYAITRNANAILGNIDNGVISGDIKNAYKGEALAVRAWMHFDAARMYCKTPTNPTINPTTDLGLPYVTSIDFQILPKRESIVDTYTKIAADLKQAENLVSDDPGLVASGRFNRAAVAGLLSKVYLYMGQWQNAVDAATRSLNLNNNVGSISDLPGIWQDATENGVLLKMKILDPDNISIGTSYSQSTSQGIKSEYVCTYDLYQLYDTTDIRKTTYIQKSPYNTIEQLHIAKYLGRTTGNRNVVDLKVLRVADVLLIRAEANAMLGNTGNAVIDLNTLKQNRYTPYIAFTFTTLQALLDEIWKERRLELAFEGDRFFDLKRRNVTINRNPTTNAYGDRADGAGIPFPPEAITLNATDYRMQLPFPQTEINVNHNFKQNPGY